MYEMYVLNVSMYKTEYKRWKNKKLEYTVCGNDSHLSYFSYDSHIICYKVNYREDQSTL